MDRKIVLVELTWTRDKDPRVPLAQASLHARLQGVAGAHVVPLVLPVNGEATADAAADAILGVADGDPAAVDVAIGCYVWAEAMVQEILPRLRRRGFAGRIVLGGPQISYAGIELETLYPDADVFVRGYGEDALARLAVDPGRPAIGGVHYAGTPDQLAQARVDVLQLPSPWLTGLIPLEGQRFIRWETQRGCPFRCAFCQHREPGARLRNKLVAEDRVTREIDLFCAAGVEEIAVLDPIFDVNPRAREILERFASRGYAGRLALQSRAELLDEAYLDAAAQLDVSLELGLQTIHRAEGRAIRRNNRLDLVARAVEHIQRRRIAHEVTLIFGLPHQTLASFKASVDWCLRRRVPVVKAFPLMLLRGTALSRDRARWGLREVGYPMPVVVESSTFTTDEWLEMGRLSEALRLTEHAHPSDVEALVRVARQLEPQLQRWQSPGVAGAG